MAHTSRTHQELLDEIMGKINSSTTQVLTNLNLSAQTHHDSLEFNCTTIKPIISSYCSHLVNELSIKDAHITHLEDTIIELQINNLNPPSSDYTTPQPTSNQPQATNQPHTITQ